LCPLRLRQMNLTRTLYLVHRQDRPLSAAAGELFQLLRRKQPKSGRVSKGTEVRETGKKRKVKAVRGRT